MKMRSEELLALADTIKILNDDDALELFKKTLPGSASFIQMQTNIADQQRQALAVVQAAKRNGRPELNFLALALSGKKVDFSKVIKMIDEMVVTLKAEQQDDNDKKEYCEMQFDLADDKKKSLERTVSNLEKAIDKANEGIKALAAEIKALEEGIKALDKSVAEATEQRKEENADYTELMASDGAAKEILGFAKNRLNKFYNPKLYKAPPKRKLSEQEQITVNMGGTLAPTAAPGGIAGTGVGASFVQVEAHSHHTYRKQDSSGAIRMLDLLIADLDKELTTSQFTEKDAQEDYEKLMKDSQAKRATDSKSLAESQ